MLRWTFRLLNNLIRLPFLPIHWALRVGVRRRGGWVYLSAQPRLAELEPARGGGVLRMLEAFGSPLAPTIIEHVREVAKSLSADKRARGLFVELPMLHAGWSECASLRAALASVRNAGKEVVVYLPDGGGNRELLVASAATRLYVPPHATVAALGLAVEARYLGKVLERFGVQVQVHARSEYKTAAETLARTSMSEPQREQMEALLDDFSDTLLTAVAERGGPARAKEMFEQALVQPEELVNLGVADGIRYEDELREVMGPETPWTSFEQYRGAHRAWMRPLRRPPYIAVIDLHGLIMAPQRGRSRRGVDSGRLTQVLRRAAKDAKAIGVVLRIDSPGGSALASDRVYREVQRVAKVKPVVAYLDNVAASGGYYIACGAHAIVGHPLVVTGSIGVVSVKFVVRELLDSIGVRTETLRTAPHADLFSPSRQYDAAEHALMEREVDSFYDAFVKIVSIGRSLPSERVRELGRGRVWSGRSAHEHGLIDQLGGMEVAVEEVRRRSKVPKHVAVRSLPRMLPIPRGGRSEPPPSPLEACGGDSLLAELVEFGRLLNSAERVWYYNPVGLRVY